MELIRCYAGIYETSRKTVSGGFLCGKKKKKRDQVFQFIEKNTWQQDHTTTKSLIVAKISLEFSITTGREMPRSTCKFRTFT